MGRAGRELVARGFDLESTIDIWLALYVELLGRKGTRRGPANQPNHS